MFNDKNILITGGTGSFGQKCIATLLKRYTPNRVVVFSRDEYKQFEMQQKFDAPSMRYFLGDVRDVERLKLAFTDIDYVIHAAALKQVPALEYNPGEAIKTNIFGAENIIAAALDHNVKKVIALSTDKAASPINLYGATKLVSDKLFVAANNIRGKSQVQFSVVRYGNVMGSRGSVIPLFKKLLAEKVSSLPITDKAMTRFSITLQQGVEFVLKSFARMQGGEIFVPKIPSVRVVDVAEAMAPGIKLNIVGLRPGEKLHELMCPRDSNNDTLEFDDHFVIKPSFVFSDASGYEVNELKEKGRPTPPDFEYNSKNNPEFLAVKEIQDMIASECS